MPPVSLMRDRNDFFPIIKKIFLRCDIRLRRSFFLVALGAIIISLSQLAVVAVVALLGAALASPERVASSKYLIEVQRYVSFDFINEPSQLIGLLLICCVAAVVVNNSLRGLYEYWSVVIVSRVEKLFGLNMMKTFLRVPYEWHLTRNSADLVVATAWTTYYGVVVKSLITIVCDILSVVIVLFAVVAFSPMVALTFFVGVSVAALILFKLFKRALDKYNHAFADLSIEINRIMNKTFHGMRDVRIFGVEERMQGEYDAGVSASIGLKAKLELLRMAPVLTLEAVGIILICLMIFCLLLSDASYATVAGTATMVAVSGWKILPSINKVLGAVTSLRASWVRIERCELYFDEIDAMESTAESIFTYHPAPRLDHSICLEKVSFSYSSRGELVLYDLDMRIRKGEAVGIIGTSGAGKSTLVNLLSGLLSPTAGRLLFDGNELSRTEVRGWLVSQMGYVPQSPYIMDASLAQNIAFGEKAGDVDMKRVLKCCEMAAIDFWDSLPSGVDTIIGERGALLSGGQQQRVAIARALYKDPELMIFDEATSSLDGKSERAIQETVYSFKGKLTLVVVAHRLSTVESCDTIYWVENGRIHKVGSPDEILPLYRKANRDR